MKRCIPVLLLACSLLLCVACGTKNNGGGKTEEPAVLIMSEVPATITAEWGERCNIPEVTAKKGKKDVPVEVVVKDSKGEDVELQGRGTRFAATDPDGYIITFSAGEGEERIVKNTNVSLADTKGPVIVLPAAAYNMTAEKGGTVSVPVATWTDKSGDVTDGGYKVTFNGVEVAVTKGQDGAPDTFVVSEYGNYTVTYSASDRFNNKTEEPILVECVRSVVLADFNTAADVYAHGMELVEEHAVEEKAMKVSASKQTNKKLDFTMFAVYPKYYDLSGFDKLQITAYASVDMDSSDEGLYLLNRKYPLSAGENLITISKEDLNAQYPGGKIPSSNPRYYDNEYLWFQLKSYDDNAVVWVDNLIGIFDNYTQDAKAPTIDTRKNALHGEMSVLEGNTLAAPAATAYDNSMKADIEVAYTVKTKAGVDITAQVQAGTFEAKEEDEYYEIVFEAQDEAGNKGSKKITVTVLTFPDTAPADYFPKTGSDYDTLQDFETTDGAVAEHAMDGTKALKLTATTAATGAIKLLKDGNRLTETDWQKYDFVQVYVYADRAGAQFAFNEKSYTLVKGPNSLRISIDELLTEIEKNISVYDTDGAFAIGYQGTIWIDAVIGVRGLEKPDAVKNYFPTDRQYDVLQSFDTAAGVDKWFFKESEGPTSIHALRSKAYRLQAASAGWAKLPIVLKKNGNVLTESDWKAYESFKLYIYTENACTFTIMSKVYSLTPGYNVLEISSADMWTQISSRDDCYLNTGYFFCQVNGTDIDLYLDEWIGIYPASASQESEASVAVAQALPALPEENKYAA